MKNILKIIPIILVLAAFILTAPASASIPHYKATHIHGMKNVTIHQGEKVNLRLRIMYKGICREHGKGITNNKIFYMNIDYFLPLKYPIKYLSPLGTYVTIDTSDLMPGRYRMTAIYEGEEGMFRVFNPSCKTTYLTVLPK